MTLNSVFASRKRNAEDEKTGQPTMSPGHFQVYTKLDEESRKDNKLVVSFLLTLNDTKGVVTYEFRGICIVNGTAADFESIMETSKNSRVPRILDILYQKLYPAMFMMAGMTSSAFPQSVALLTDIMSTEPIPVRQEITAEANAEKPDTSSTSSVKSAPKAVFTKPAAAKSAPPKIGTTDQRPIGAKPRVEVDKPAA